MRPILESPGWITAAIALLALAPARAAEPGIAIDFSSAGYGGGGVALPEVPARFAVTPSTGDDTRLVQAAIDAVGRMPLDAHGLRGAVVLRGGRFRIEGQLRLGGSRCIAAHAAGRFARGRRVVSRR